MLLTIKQPVHQGYRSFHDYTPPTPPGPSPPPLRDPNRAASSLFTARPSISSMSTPHRGLPPPAAMTLPHPQQPAPSLPPTASQPLNPPLGQLPAPPQQWQGAEESMRNWLLAKTEEDKRKQEEEKTRQESLRLEQRKIEQDMLRTSLSGGIPPHMIPMVFAGMGGGNLPNASLEWAQHYMSQVQHHQTQQIQQHAHQQQLLPPHEQTSPEQHQRRDSRAIQHYAPQAPAPIGMPSTPIAAHQQQSSSYQPSYQMSPTSQSRQNVSSQAVVARQQQPHTSHLPRLNTGEMLPSAGPGMHVLSGQQQIPGHPMQQTQQVVQRQETQASPSIYFHHWQPPTSQAGSTSGAHQLTTPSDHPTSPKKRKATGPQQPAPPPTSQPHYTSPPYSEIQRHTSMTPSGNRRKTHTRQRSDLSSRGLNSYGRPISRHQHSESSFGAYAQGTVTTSPPESHSHAPEYPHMSETRRESHPLTALLHPNEPPHSEPLGMRDSPYASASAGPEMRHEITRRVYDERHIRRDSGSGDSDAVIKRDEGSRD